MSDTNRDSPVHERKRKRNKHDATTGGAEPEQNELEIDVNLPEPPSKKAKRKEKKAAAAATTSQQSPPLPAENGDEGWKSVQIEDNKPQKRPKKTKAPSELSLAAKDLVKAYFESDTAQNKGPAAQTKSEHGIWIGNLPFSATRDTLREFLRDQGSIEGRDIVRLHLPAPADKGPRGNTMNKGFAYIDFTDREILEKALGLSERLISGRRVLIKNSRSFEGRPMQQAEKRKGDAKEPTKRVFVGNLGFDVTKDEVQEFFAPCGKVEDCFLATFEDSGKCKGFGWVTFGDVDAASAAVRGYIYKHDDQDEDEEGSADESPDEGADEDDEIKDGETKKKKPKKQKHFVNRLHGRTLRCEFAEDAQTRYKKRFTGAGRQDRSQQSPTTELAVAEDGEGTAAPFGKKPDADQRREERRKRHERQDARAIAPGKALAGAQRSSGAIVASAGRKTSFE